MNFTLKPRVMKSVKGNPIIACPSKSFNGININKQPHLLPPFNIYENAFRAKLDCYQMLMELISIANAKYVITITSYQRTAIYLNKDRLFVQNNEE